MEKLRQKLDVSARALVTLDEAMALDLAAADKRDIAIMRFIYTFEALWRSLQRYLAIVEGVDTGTPKASLRGARDAGLLSDEQTEAALAMVDDRNRTVHIYNEKLAKEIFGRLPGHVAVLHSLHEAMTARVKTR